MGDFYGAGIEIWAGFGPVHQLLRPFFSCFHEQKKFKNGPMVKRSQYIRIKNLLHKYFAGMPMVGR